MREDPGPLAYSLAFMVPETCFRVACLSVYVAAWLDFNAEVTVSACQRASSSEVLKSVNSPYKAFTRLIGKDGMPEELTMFCPELCLTYTENGYVVKVLMYYLSHFGFLFCFVALFRPTTLDAFAFGFLAPIYKVCFPRVQLQEHLKQLPNLCRFCDDVLSCYFRLTVSGKLCFFSPFCHE